MNKEMLPISEMSWSEYHSLEITLCCVMIPIIIALFWIVDNNNEKTYESRTEISVKDTIIPNIKDTFFINNEMYIIKHIERERKILK